MTSKLVHAAMIAIGAVVGAGGFTLLAQPYEQAPTAQTKAGEPLYWVAPMDPNYRRDKPGKSPMGMDLIPVYEEQAGAATSSPGTVRVSPDVVNNLGVRTAPVTRGVFNVAIKTVGYVQYDEDRLVHIHPRVEGWIEKLHVKAEGDPVKKGAPLYEIYSPLMVNAQEELVLAMNRGNPRLIEASLDRLRALQISESTIRNLQETKRVRQTITFYAPQSGVVDNLNIREGFFVKPGVSMMSIGALDEVWVVGEVFERQVGLVKEGDRVTITLDYLPGRTWTGKVDYVYPTLNSKTRTARVRMRLANPDRQLKPNMFAQVTIAAVADADRLLIPREALIRTGSQARVVLALGEGEFKSVEVEVGRVGEAQVEVTGGLAEGERIVTSAQFLLDSESSKSSDFKRMHRDEVAAAVVAPVWVEANIETLMPEHRMATLAHEAVQEWGWPPMTMDFGVDQGVDFSALRVGMRLHVEIARDGDDNYRITKVHLPDDAKPGAGTRAGGASTTAAGGPRAGNHQGIDRGDYPPWTMEATMTAALSPNPSPASGRGEQMELLRDFHVNGSRS